MQTGDILDLIFDKFNLFSFDNADRILVAVRPAVCLLDPYPSWLLNASDKRIRGPLIDIINLSLEMGVYLENLKEALILLLLKKTLLDTMDLTNYCPVLNFSFLIKITERVVRSFRVFSMTYWHWMLLVTLTAYLHGWLD